MSEKSILFVRSGGGMPGLDIHVGIWLALNAAGIESTHNSGTSAGACIAALDSAGWAPEDARDALHKLRDSDVREPHVAWRLRLPFLRAVMHNRKIYRVLMEMLPASWDAMSKPLSAWSVDQDTWERHDLASPSHTEQPAKAVLASMAIPGLFPAVEVGGCCYVDGGVRFNLPLLGNWREFDEVYLLIAGGAREDYRKPKRALTAVINVLRCVGLDGILDVLDQTHGVSNVHVIWPKLDTPNGLLHFDHTLIGDAYAQTADTLRRIGRA